MRPKISSLRACREPLWHIVKRTAYRKAHTLILGSAMAAKLLNQLRVLYTRNHQTLRHKFAYDNGSSLAFNRAFSDVPLESVAAADSSSSVLSERPVSSHGQTKSNDNLNRVLTISSLNKVELAKFSAIAETW